MRSTIRAAVAAAVLAGGLAAAPSAASATAAGVGAGLDWQLCPYPGSPASLQCASLQLPLDYADPHGATVTVTVDRLPATGPHPVGSLFFDPGGPGGSGTALVYFESLGLSLFSTATRANFDLIGIDPRGVGLSSPVRCDPALLNQHVSRFPTDEAGFRRLVAANAALGRSCRALTGPLLEHVDTVSAARDLEAFRAALGQGRLNYLGLSYGSQLGSTYAHLFPTRIRTMALDGALDHSLRPRRVFADESRAYQDSLDRFVVWCAATAACALHGEDAGRVFRQVAAQADRVPIPAPACVASGGCRPEVTGEDIRFDAQNLLLFKDPIPLVAENGWNALALALQQAAAGDASALSPPVAQSELDDALNGSPTAIGCLDWPTPVRTLADLRRLQRLGTALAPSLRGASQSWTLLAGCVGWPAPVVNPPGPLDAEGAPAILIVNATHDPSTAYVWARHLARQLSSSVLLTRDGDGHTSYLTKAPSLTRDAIDTYLATGRTPPPGTVYPD